MGSFSGRVVLLGHPADRQVWNMTASLRGL